MSSYSIVDRLCVLSPGRKPEAVVGRGRIILIAARRVDGHGVRNTRCARPERLAPSDRALLRTPRAARGCRTVSSLPCCQIGGPKCADEIVVCCSVFCGSEDSPFGSRSYQFTCVTPTAKPKCLPGTASASVEKLGGGARQARRGEWGCTSSGGVVQVLRARQSAWAFVTG